MAGLDPRDIDILRYYAKEGNRILYWNYLAQHPGNDGYGVLALSVVRNDNMPGAIANAYAQLQASMQNHRHLSEREWETFGQDLIRRDLASREAQLAKHRPDLALNLPVKDVQKAHDAAFDEVHITPDAWTPRHLLEAARRNGSEADAEGIWRTMLDSSALGTKRLGLTTKDILACDHDRPLEGSAYLARLTVATGTAADSLAYDDPHRIGGRHLYVQYFPRQHLWQEVNSASGSPTYTLVTDPREVQELNDARAVRLERQEKATQFHPDDPHRTVKKSPFTLADAAPELTTPSTQVAEQASPAQSRTSHAPGSIDDLFERLTHAAMKRDFDGLHAVGWEYMQSTAGQQWLQSGRDHLQAQREQDALAAQQALAQQAAQEAAVQQHRGPVMRM